VISVSELVFDASHISISPDRLGGDKNNLPIEWHDPLVSSLNAAGLMLLAVAGSVTSQSNH
jgi:hypothetical protein